MNTERLNVIALAALDDLKKTNTENILTHIIQALQNQITSPQQAQYQQQVSENLNILYKSLDTAPSNEFSPTWKLILKEIGGEGLFGKELKSKIEEVFARNHITPSIALKEIQPIQTTLNKLSTALGQITLGFKNLDIGVEELKQGECELGVLVPRVSVENKLKNFGQELSELDKILGVFAEVVTGSRPGYDLRSVSSSDLSVFVALIPGVAACIAQTVEKVVTTYKNLLKIRKIYKELKETGISQENLKGIGDHSNQLMEKTIQKIVEDLLNTYKIERAKGRENELSIELKFALGKLANRIDKGYNIEIRVKPIEDEKIKVDDEKQTVEIREQIKIIQSATKTLQFLKLDGEPILCLPEKEKQKKEKE